MSRMESFLIISKDKKTIDEYSLKLCKEKDIAGIDISIVENEGSIGIAEIRLLKKSIFLKPLRGTTKACIIKNAENLTVEAQNALLKLLEEPPDNTIIILSANDINAFLPTVLSRCSVIQLSSSQNIKPLVLPQESIGQKLKRAQDLAKNKEEAIEWIENAILYFRQQLIDRIANEEKKNLSSLTSHLSSLQNACRILKTTNTNPRLTLENLFLNL